MAKKGGGIRTLKSFIRRLAQSGTARTPEPPAADRDFSGLHPVYVGKSRRRYLVNPGLLSHPLLRGLVDDSEDPGCGEGATVVARCEVVLFEHLLWMLENADPLPGSLDELLDYYCTS